METSPDQDCGDDIEILDAEAELVEVPLPDGVSPESYMQSLARSSAQPGQPSSLGFAHEEAPSAPVRQQTGYRSRQEPAEKESVTKAAKKRPVRYMPMLQLPPLGTIKKSYGIFMYSSSTFLIIALLASVPGIAESFILPGWKDDSWLMALLLPIGVWIIKESISGMLQGVAAYATFQILRESVPETGAAFAKGLTHFASIAAAAILCVILRYASFAAGVILYILGFGFLISVLAAVIPFVVFSCLLSVTVPACIVERLGPIASIRRSAELTRKFRGPVFWILVLWYLWFAGMYFMVGMALSLVRANPAVLQIGFLLIAWIEAAGKNVLFSVIYYELRKIKDGVDVDRLIEVFD